MTKQEMVKEMINGVNYVGGNERVIQNRCKALKKRIEEVYNYYLETNKTKEDKVFCINLLVVF